MVFLENVLGAFFPPKKGRIIYTAPIMEEVSQNFITKFLSNFLPGLFPSAKDTTALREIDNMALDEAAIRLRNSEGMRQDVYIDTRGFLTVGIGHKVVAGDNLKLGDVISPERVNELFNKDVGAAFNAAKAQARELGKYNTEMIAALTEVNFQLGTGWNKKFANTWELLKAGNWRTAIRNLQQSAWFNQTPTRVTAFINSITNVYS